MRIFHIITASEYGGAQSVVASLLQDACQDERNEVFVVYGGEGEAWTDLDHRIKRIRVGSHRRGISFKDLFLLLKLFYLRLRYRPDIVHLHSSKTSALGRIVFSPKRIVYTIHGFDSVRLAFPRFMVVEKALRNRVYQTIAISEHDKYYLKEEGIDKNLILIYNGLEDKTEYTFEERADLVEKLTEIRALYSKTIMCIARISQQKKFELFVELASAMPEYAFVWIGNKDEMTSLPSNVYCLGEAANACTYLKYADMFVLPTNYEGLPISVLEALSYSRPVVASAVGGIPELLDGSNGFAVVNSLEAFEEKIRYILNDGTIQENMSKEARSSYLARFTIDKMTDAYRTVYSNLINDNR